MHRAASRFEQGNANRSYWEPTAPRQRCSAQPPSATRQPMEALLEATATPELTTVRLVFRARDVVLVKGIVEAHDGLAQVYASSGGDISLVACADRASELRHLADSLVREFNGALRV
jgi:hypothetical protein